MEDDVDVLGRPHQPVAVADVADQEADVRTRSEPLTLVELLRLVAPEDAHDRGVGLQEVLDEAGSDRSRSPGDEHAAALH